MTRRVVKAAVVAAAAGAEKLFSLRNAQGLERRRKNNLRRCDTAGYLWAFPNRGEAATGLLPATPAGRRRG